MSRFIRRPLLILGLLTFLIPHTPSAGQARGDGSDRREASDTNHVVVNSRRSRQTREEDGEAEAAALRLELAQTKMEVQELRTQLERIQQFLAERDLDETLRQWREEREQLADERRQLQQERIRLREERRKLQKQIVDQAEQQAEQTEQVEDALEPKWNARYQMGLIQSDQEVIYVRSHHGSTLVEVHPDIDRRNVKVRGTFENRSEAAWRYTFEIRIAKGERDPKTRRRIVIGSWRYQTPLMGPNDLHEWEVTVPVTDVGLIDVVQIGNVKADQPPRDPYPEPNARTDDQTDGRESAGGTASRSN